MKLRIVLSFLTLFNVLHLKAQFSCMDSKQNLAVLSSPSINNNAKSDTFNILHYQINLDLTAIANQIFKADAKIFFQPLISGANTLNLDLHLLQVDSVNYINASGQSDTNFSYQYNDSLLSVHFNANVNLSSNQDYLHIYYSGYPKIDASNWGGFHADQGYYYNLGVGFASNPHTFGRAWFPCYDNFVEKSTYALSVKSRAPLLPMLIGDSIARYPLLGDTILSTSFLSEEIPTYLASFALANYQFLEDTVQGLNGIKSILLAAKAADTANLKASFLNLKATFHAFEEYFGAYQWPRIGYAATTVGAMEHATSIHYPISLINGNLSGEDIMAHELAHHWFGNLITCESADDMWINEGMAEYSSHLYQEKVYSRERYLDVVRANAWRVLTIAHTRDGGVFRPLFAQPHEYVYGFHTYQKGAMVGHNLRHYLGDVLFFSTLDSLLSKYAYQNLSSASFLSELQRISGQAKMSDFGQDWVYQAGFSQFSVDDWNYQASTQEVNFSLKQRLYEAPAFHNNVPVDVSFFAADGQVIHHNFLHSGANSQHIFPLGFNPVAVLSSYSGSLLTATGMDHLEIDKLGAQSGEYSSITVDCTNFIDSGSVILMQHLVKADKKSINNFDFHLADKRYFSIQKLGLSQSNLQGEIGFEGSNGKPESSLLQNGNDSIVLLFRAKGSDQWNIYPYQLKKVASANSRRGSFELSQIENGDYVFANTSESLSISKSNNDAAASLYEFFPNPTKGQLKILSHRSEKDVFVQIYDQGGRLKLVESFSQEEKDKMQVDLSDLKPGQYVIKINEFSYPLLKL